MFGSSGALEGARLNTDLYDAYLPSTSTYDLPASLSRTTDRSISSPRLPEPTTSSWGLNSQPPRSPPTLHSSTGPIWTGLGGPGSASLRRSSTVRRPHRSQPVDLSDFASFTSRRRSAIRNSALQDDSAREDSSSDVARRSTSVENTRSGETSTATDSGTARHFDLSAWISRRRPSFGITSTSALPDEPAGNPSSSQLWYSMTDYVPPEPSSFPLAALSRRSSSTDLNDDRRQVIAPRLRRGGLRPPESLLLHGPGTTPGTLPRVTTESITPADSSVLSQADTGGEVQAEFAPFAARSTSPVGESL